MSELLLVAKTLLPHNLLLLCQWMFIFHLFNPKVAALGCQVTELQEVHILPWLIHSNKHQLAALYFGNSRFMIKWQFNCLAKGQMNYLNFLTKLIF